MLCFKKISGFKFIVIFGCLKLATFLYFVSLTKTRIIPKYKQNVLIDISSFNDDLISTLFNFNDKNDKYKKIRSQIPHDKLKEQWYIYSIRENSDENSSNDIKLELAQMNHKFYYYSETIASTYDGFTIDNKTKKPCIDIARLLKQFDETDYVVLKIDVKNGTEYDLLFHIIKENALNLIDHIYIDYKNETVQPFKSFPDFFSKLFRKSKINELKT